MDINEETVSRADMNGTPTLEQLLIALKDKILAAFKDLDTWTPEEKRSSKRFTDRLFSRLADLARVFALDVRMTKKEDPRNWEFLYDVTFLVTRGGFNDRNGYFAGDAALRRAVLVLECEWSPDHDDIIYDFSKLLWPAPNSALWCSIRARPTALTPCSG